MSRYRVLNQKHGIKEVIWDVGEVNPHNDNPTLEELNQAADNEFPETPKNKLTVFSKGGVETYLVKSR